MTCDFGSIFLAPVPFTDGRTVKDRPVVVVSPLAYNRTHPDVIVMPLTTQALDDDPFACSLSEWELFGLRYPSWVKPLVVSMEQADLLTLLGHFDEAACDRLPGCLRNLLRL